MIYNLCSQDLHHKLIFIFIFQTSSLYVIFKNIDGIYFQKMLRHTIPVDETLYRRLFLYIVFKHRTYRSRILYKYT
jgi:hypothetical protein